MMPADRDQANAMLRQPPDLSVLRLSSNSRLGLIVMALLAGRSGIRVTLSESDYGGIKAVILIPASIIHSAGTHDGPETIRAVEQASR